MNASLNEKLRAVKWGEFKYKEVFNRIEQGRRLKKDDQIDGTIPFVMSGTTNAGVVNYISNPVASFPKNAITIDIFGNTFYRNYAFGAGDDIIRPPHFLICSMSGFSQNTLHVRTGKVQWRTRPLLWCCWLISSSNKALSIPYYHPPAFRDFSRYLLIRLRKRGNLTGKMRKRTIYF